MDIDEVGAAIVEGPTTVIIRHLREGDELIRCAAAKALGALGDGKAASALVDALLDQDHDVRTDSMEALARCARPENAEAVRRSLEGDPVKEVKVFAIEALARLGDRAAIPLLRALAKDRSDDQVAWEDEAGMWDDWLDVQTAAIKALGIMQASEAIDDLLDARTDEMGQELDIVVFAALAEIEDGGLSALFALLHDRDPKVRERVIRALSKAKPEAMLPMQTILLRDASPAIRRLAINTLEPESEAVTDLVRGDPDPEVRTAALAAFASARPDLVMAALRDPDERVLAIAVASLPEKLDTSVADDLAANLWAWMETAGPTLAAAAAAALPKLAGHRAEGALCPLAANTERSIEARIAGLQALATLSSETVVKVLEERIEDPVRQIRAAALASLAVIAQRQDDLHRDAARAIFAAAIRGEIGTGVETATVNPPAGANDVGASKAEGGKGHIAISPDGEIITLDADPDDQTANRDNIIEGRFPTSTLDAIQTESPAAKPDDESEARSPNGQSARRRRVAVDGPDDINQDIRVVALAMIGDCSGSHIEGALLETLQSDDQNIRLAATEALARCSGTSTLAPILVDICETALSDPNATIRAHAAIVIEQNAANASDLLSAHLDDADPVFRSVALRASAKTSPQLAVSALRDPSSMVRRTAMRLLTESTDDSCRKRAVDICLSEGLTDVLASACKHRPDVRQELLTLISKSDLTTLQLRTALETLAST